MDFLKDNWIAVTVVVAISFVLWSARGRSKKIPGESIQMNVKCPKCGWQGVVSKYASDCRKCRNKDTRPV